MDWSKFFYYDETSPSCLRWAISIFSGKHGNINLVDKGSPAGGQDNNGYYIVTVEGKPFKAHRVIWELHNGKLSSEEFIDHEDGDESNNKITNLRKTDNKFNGRNRRKSSNNKTGYTGVCKCTNYLYGYISYSALWTGVDGKRRSKSFSSLKYGLEESLLLAVEYRDKMIAELNKQGAGYTDRHGKD